MVALAILTGVVGLLLLLFFFPVFIRLRLSPREGFSVTVRILGIPFHWIPSAKEEEKKEEKPATPVDKKKKAQEKPKKKKPSKVQELKEELKTNFEQDGVGATLSYLGEAVKLVTDGVKDVLHTLTVDRFDLHLLMCGEDASDTALLHGKVCGVLYPSLAVLMEAMTVRRHDVTVQPDYLGERSSVQGEMRLHFCPICLAIAVLTALIKLKFITDTSKEANHNGK